MFNKFSLQIKATEQIIKPALLFALDYEASFEQHFFMELQILDVSKTYSNGVQALKDMMLTIPVGMCGR